MRAAKYPYPLTCGVVCTLANVVIMHMSSIHSHPSPCVTQQQQSWELKLGRHQFTRAVGTIRAVHSELRVLSTSHTIFLSFPPPPFKMSCGIMVIYSAVRSCTPHAMQRRRGLRLEENSPCSCVPAAHIYYRQFHGILGVSISGRYIIMIGSPSEAC